MCVWEMPTVVRSVVGWRCYPLGYLLSNECCCRDAYVFYVNITFIHSMRIRIRIRTHTCRDSRWSDDDRRMYPSMNEEARRKLFIFGLLLFSFHYTTTSKFLYLWPTRERARKRERVSQRVVGSFESLIRNRYACAGYNGRTKLPLVYLIPRKVTNIIIIW